MEKKTAKLETHLPILPDHLIVEQILPRLPVKSLIRFKSVSKYWLSTISSNKFEKTHLKYSSSCPQCIMIEHLYLDGKNYLLSLDEYSDVKELVKLECKYPLMIAPRPHSGGTFSSTYVIGSINGLVCLFDEYFCFYLWNPATHQCHNADSPYLGHADSREEVSIAGFGYISSMDDYRIGCICCAYDDEEDEVVRHHVHVFSLRAGKWEKTATLDENFYLSIDPEGLSVSVNDTIYWPPRVRQGGNGVGTHIDGLNLVSGQLKKFSLKNVVIGYDEVDVFQMEGCLSLSCIRYLKVDHVSDVWMLKQHDDWTSWEKIFSINIGKTRLLYLFETGKCLVVKDLEKLKLLDPSKVALEECEEGTVIRQGSEEETSSYISQAWGYVESLMSPFGTTVSNEIGE
ncbi:hypothetical protein BVRB_9g219200 [Beta vulgaris subsp. vulgaris]|nr:hypothetical protein BVRB_9g219200 [Beta vulgaris subsp. vulgaris]